MLKNVRLITKLIIPLALYFNSFTVLSQTKDEFYEDGTLKGRGEYSNYTYMNPKIGSINHPKTKFKKKTGEWTYWYRDGALMRTESYLDEKKGYDLANIPDGSWKYYDHEETLIKEEIYREGRLIGLEVFAQGIIDEKGQEVRIVPADTSIHGKIMLIGPNAKSLVKENIYYDSLLIRKEIRTGQTPYYYEIYKETSETTDSSNLIVNSGFEEYKKLPDGSGQLDICVRGWYNAGTGKATYYTKYTDNQYASSPINSNGYQMPHDGSAYAGINTQSQEYIMISLKDTLQKDSLYCVELYVSKAENSSAGIAELGAIFSAEKKIIRANEPAIPHITFTSRSGFNDTESWMRTCTTFTAEGYELYIILGSFKEKPIAHYYIDDISIRAVKSAIDCNCIEEITFDQLSYYDFKVGMNIRMAFVTFEQSKSVLTASSYIELDNFAAMMQEHKTMIAELASHTFNSGNIESDKQLTSARAKAIWDYLVKKGIAANRIKYKGYGSTEPIADNSTEEGKSKNDRVEIRIISL